MKKLRRKKKIKKESMKDRLWCLMNKTAELKKEKNEFKYTEKKVQAHCRKRRKKIKVEKERE